MFINSVIINPLTTGELDVLTIRHSLTAWMIFTSAGRQVEMRSAVDQQALILNVLLRHRIIIIINFLSMAPFFVRSTPNSNANKRHIFPNITDMRVLKNVMYNNLWLTAPRGATPVN